MSESHPKIWSRVGLLTRHTLPRSVDELFETLAQTSWPSFGFMVANNATVLWESWGVAPPLNAGICKTDQAVISAGWLGAIAKYPYTMFAGFGQAAASVGYAHVVLKPLVPMRTGGLDSVNAHMAVPAGVLRSGWERHGTFRLNFHRFDRFELDLRGRIHVRGAAFSRLRLKLAGIVLI